MTYSKRLVKFSKLANSAALGFAHIGEAKLGQVDDTRIKVLGKRMTINDGYGIDDATGALLPEASTGTVTHSERLPGLPTRGPMPLRAGDRVEAVYDDTLITRHFLVIKVDQQNKAAYRKDGKAFLRTYTYTLRDVFYRLLENSVFWEYLPEENPVARMARFGISISYSNMTTAHQSYLLGIVMGEEEGGSSTLLEQLRRFTLATLLPIRPASFKATNFMTYEVVEDAVAWWDMPLTPNPGIGPATDWSNEYGDVDTEETGRVIDGVSVKRGDMRFTGGQRIYPDGSAPQLNQFRLGTDQLGPGRVIKVGFTAPGVIDILGTPTVVARITQEFAGKYNAAIEIAPTVYIEGPEVVDDSWLGPVQLSSLQHSGFPGLTIKAGGELFAVWRRGSNHSGIYDADIYASTSTDRGKTWSAQIKIIDGAASVDLRDPSVTRLTSGTIVCSYFEDYNTAQLNNTYTMRSTNGGVTWTDRTMVIVGAASSPIVELPLSTAPVAPPVNQGMPLNAFVLGSSKLGDAIPPVPLTTSGRLLQATYGATSNNCRVHYSDDEGQTWAPLAYIINGLLSDGGVPQEPWLALDPATGTLIATVRSNGTGQAAFRSVSVDNGATWSTPAPMSFASDSRIQTIFVNGKLHAYYRGYTDYFNLYHRESIDLGITWSIPDLVDSHQKRNTYAAPIDMGAGVIGLAWAWETWDGANPNVALPNYSQVWFTRRND